jgi:hypothetical protein
MLEHDGHGIFPLPPFMDEMDAQAIDFGAEVGELVEYLLLSALVELVVPVIDQLTHVLKVGAVIPFVPCDFVRPARASEAV